MKYADLTSITSLEEMNFVHLALQRKTHMSLWYGFFETCC